MFEAIKIILSAIIIFIASEVAKKSIILGSIIVSLPIMSILTISWLQVKQKIQNVLYHYLIIYFG